MRNVTLILLLAISSNMYAQGVDKLGKPIIKDTYHPSGEIYKNGWIDFNKNGVKDIYEDPTKSVELRIEDLLSQMNLNEKTAQMATLYGYGRVLTDALPTDEWKTSRIWKDGIGAIDEHLNGYPATSENNKNNPLVTSVSKHAWALNEVQRFFVEQTRLGIPTDFTNEALRGVESHTATNFPTQLGVGHSWNRELVYKMGELEAHEARALGYTNLYAPILDVGRDQRWGRYEEVYGESPYLVAELGIAMVRGIQQNGVAATAKHYVGYSNGKGGREGMARNNPQMSRREMEQIHVYPFRRVIMEGGLLNVMSSYNDFDGEPIQGSYYWLTQRLRKDFGMRGYVVSDSDAVEYLYSKHYTAEDMKEAVLQSVLAGLNVRCTFRSPDSFIVPLRELVAEGRLKEEIVNDRVRDILRVKFLTGQFDNPYVRDLKNGESVVCSKENQNIALQASRESIVLLKNDNNYLPIDKKTVKRIAVIGPNATKEDFALMRYGPNSVDVTTTLEGIKSKVGSDVDVTYEMGCEIVDDNWPDSEIFDFPLTSKEDSLMNAAYQVAEKSDLVVMVLGGGMRTCGENKSRSSLELPGRQQQLLERIFKLENSDRKVVLVLINGRPLSVNWADRYMPAIVEAWYPGSFGGEAIADVLFGDYNPGGKLTVTFPRTVGQIPFNFPSLPSAQSDSWGANGLKSHRARVNGAIYPFGYGLSYTTFEYSSLVLSDSVITPNQTLTVKCDIKNTGTREGDEVVQLYIRDKISSVMAYEKVLRGFERVHLKAGETKTVEMKVKPQDLEILDINYNWTVEPGEFKVMIGASSEDIKLASDFEVVDAKIFNQQKSVTLKEKLGKSVSASINNLDAVNCLDNNMATSWHGTKDQYITFELPSGSAPSTAEISWSEGDPVEFEIQLSSGGGLFIPVYKGRSGETNGSMEKYTFSGSVASDMRIIILSPKASIQEVRIK